MPPVILVLFHGVASLRFLVDFRADSAGQIAFGVVVTFVFFQQALSCLPNLLSECCCSMSGFSISLVWTDTQHVAASLQASWHVPPRSRFLWHLQKDKGIYCLHRNNPKHLFPTLGSWLHVGISCWGFLPVLLQRDVGMLQVLVKHVRHAC